MNSLRRRLRRSLTFVVGSGLLLALLLMAAAGPLLYPQGPWGMVLVVEEDSDGSRGSWIIRCGSLDPFWGRKCQDKVAERPGISFNFRESHYNGCYNEP